MEYRENTWRLKIDDVVSDCLTICSSRQRRGETKLPTLVMIGGFMSYKALLNVLFYYIV